MHFSYSMAATQPVPIRTGGISSQPGWQPEDRTLPMTRRMASAAEGALAAAVLSLVALLIHGYHPYAEDGGLYVSSILKALHPSLYPSWSEFVTVQTRYSLFAPIVARLIRAAGWRISVAVFILHVCSIWATLFAGWLLAARCYASRQARYGAISLLALWLTMPVAGTSLLLMDPYLSARSISTPCGLFAIAAMLDVSAAIRYSRPISWRSASVCIFSIFLAAIVHPLMAGLIICSLLLLLACSRRQASTRAIGVAALCLLAVALAAGLYWFGPLAAPNYLKVELTRDYWFLCNWHWYEIIGLVAPLLVLELLTRTSMRRGREASRWIARMSIAAGLTAILISLLFVHQSSLSYTVARLQPLRIFHIIYALMILVLGAVAAERLLARNSWRWAIMFALMGGTMFYVQLCTFPASSHLELPWSAPTNGWEQAFLWIRGNTPKNALFALDADYINHTGEDAQYFRAIARRSALPDYSKDGGLAAIDPQLADIWTLGRAAQAGIDTETDAQRMAALLPLGVNWVVLPTSTSTNFACPYRNPSAKVCFLMANSH